jgi:hypothetical protein
MRLRGYVCTNECKGYATKALDDKHVCCCAGRATFAGGLGAQASGRAELSTERRVEDLLMQGLAGGHHREHVLVALDEALHEDRPRAVVLEELLHLRRKLLRVAAAERLDAHRLGELDEVRVVHRCVRVTSVVEQI